MSYSVLYDSLIKYADLLCKEKSDKELYQIGKSLPFRKRTIFDYKIKSIRENFEFIDFFAEVFNKKNMIKKLIDNDELSYVIKNFDEISLYNFYTKEPVLEYIKNNLNRISNEDIERINYFLTRSMLEMKYELEDKDINKVKNVFKDIAKKQDLFLIDIRKIDYGEYSNIYKLGNKIIKIGHNRAVKRIVDNNRILLPDEIFRVKSNIIEITDYIEDKSIFTKDEIYEVYKELRNQGVIWLDPTKENLKRVNENIIKLQNEKAKNRDKYPFIKNRRLINRPLKNNELIIIDLDHLVDERDKAKINEINDILREDILSDRENYEKRYLLEKKKTIE